MSVPHVRKRLFKVNQLRILKKLISLPVARIGHRTQKSNIYNCGIQQNTLGKIILKKPPESD
jgi:hypothetical protein